MNLFNDEVTPESKREELLAKWKDKTPAEVLEAKINADLYIESIIKQKDDLSKDYLEMRKQVDAQASLQELVDRLNKETPSISATPPAKEGSESQKEPLDIKKEFSSFYEEARRAEKQASNAREVQNKLRERFGNSYQDVLRDTGLSDARINEIAAESPEAVYRLVGLDNKRETFQAPPRNSETSRFAPKGQTKRDWNYYQELKKTNPMLYLDPKLSVQMHNDAVEQGDAFYG